MFDVVVYHLFVIVFGIYIYVFGIFVFGFYMFGFYVFLCLMFGGCYCPDSALSLFRASLFGFPLRSFHYKNLRVIQYVKFDKIPD